MRLLLSFTIEYTRDTTDFAIEASMTVERLTEDLLERLLTADSPEEYLDCDSLVDQELVDYLEQLRRERGLKKADVIRGSALNSTFVYDIFNGKSKPGRNNAIMLAFGLHCSLRETQRLLRLVGVAELWPKNRRDAIIIWCINQGDDLTACDEELWRLGEETLVDPES